MSLREYIGERRESFAIALGLLIILLLGFLDLITGPEIAFSVFYFIPICLVTWFTNRRIGVLVAFACGAVWLAAVLLNSPAYSNPVLPYWKAAVRFGTFLIVVYVLSELRQALQREKSLARTDHITGISNARAFFDSAAVEMDRSRRYNRPFAVAFMDADDFKILNDRFGHTAGDAALRVIAQALKGSIRSTDVAARLGGDEFAILLPETGPETAQAVMRRVQASVVNEVRENGWLVTMSIGVAAFISTPDSLDQMMEKVDRLMYAAKAQGKNTMKHEVYDKRAVEAAQAVNVPRTLPNAGARSRPFSKPSPPLILFKPPPPPKNIPFWRYLARTAYRPQETFVDLLDDPRRLTQGLRAVALIGGLYTLTVVCYALAGAAVTSAPFVPIPAGDYYFWEIFFALPVLLLGWGLASGVVQLLSRLFKGEGTFQDTLGVLGFAVSVPMFATWIPEMITSVLMASGVMSHSVWLGMIEGTGPWQAAAAAYLLISAGLYFFLVPLAVAAIHRLAWWQSWIMSLAAIASFGGVIFFFVR